MLSVEQFRLMKLAEECSEVAQRCCKQMAYGADEIQHGQAMRNKARTREELLDLLVCVQLLTMMGELEPISGEDIHAHYADKLPKIRAMSQLSVNQGEVEPALMLSIPEELT